MNKVGINMGDNPQVFPLGDDTDDKGYHCGQEPFSR